MMKDIFNNSKIKRALVGAIPYHDYDETVWETWDIFVLADAEYSLGTQAPQFPIEIRAEHGLKNPEVQDSLEVLLQSENILAASHVGLFRVASAEGGSWQATTSEDGRFALISENGPSLVSVSLSPDVATRHRKIAIREVILALSTPMF